MKELKRWAELQCELKMNDLQKIDNWHPCQTALKNRDYIVGQIDAYTEILDVIELLKEE